MEPTMTHPALASAAPRHNSAPAPRGDSSIGGLLLESGKITPEAAERVLRMQKDLGIRFGEAAQRLGLVTEADIQQVLARQFDYPYLLPGRAIIRRACWPPTSRSARRWKRCAPCAAS
jgi:protein-tyrosine kinase